MAPHQSASSLKRKPSKQGDESSFSVAKPSSVN